MSNSPNAQLPLRAAASTSAPVLKLADGTIEALKWLAVVLMVGDHVNKYLFDEKLPVLFEAARICMPLFAILLGYNLSRPGAGAAAAWRTFKRLVLFGALASIPYTWMSPKLAGGWWPLNVLIELAALAAVILVLERGGPGHRVLAALVFVAGGALAEYWWPAIGLGLVAYSYAKQPSWGKLALGLGCCAALALINGNHWALAALPLLAVASRLQLSVPRIRAFFYWFYPVHLGLIALVKLALA
jgi:hypothetical protein